MCAMLETRVTYLNIFSFSDFHLVRQSCRGLGGKAEVENLKGAIIYKVEVGEVEALSLCWPKNGEWQSTVVALFSSRS